MSIRINSVKFSADKKLEQFIEEKVNKLISKHENITDVEVFLKLENDKSGENKITEIKLGIPGNDFFAKKQSTSFEAATDTAVEALRRQLKKHTGKVRKRK